jgi:hypothetical protein
MFVQIPDKSSKKWSASQVSDLFGNITRSKALNFDKKGYLDLAPKPVAIYSESDDADFDVVVCIEMDDSSVYVITTDDIWSMSLQSGAPSASALTGGSPPNTSFNSDAVWFNGTLHVTGTSTIHDYSGGTWTSRVSGMSSSYPHPLCVSEHQQYLAVGNGSSVRLYSTAYALITTLTIPSDQIVEWIRWRNNQLYIGTRNINGGSARLYIWNGSGTAAQQGFGFPCDWFYSGCEFNNALCVVASSGQILQFTGAGFSEVAAFPVYYVNRNWNSSASNSNLMGKVSSRGMVAKGRKLFINVDATVSTGTDGESDNMIDFPSGLWVLDLDVGLYHKAGFANKKFSSVAVSSRSTNTLTLASAISFETADPILFDTISALTGIRSNAVYYAIKVSTTELKVAKTAAEAVAGTAITLGGTPLGSDIMCIDTYRSVGATHCQRSGGIALFSRIVPCTFFASEVIWGGAVNDNLGNELTFIQSFGMGRNVGSITMPKVEAGEIKDIFNKIVAKFPKVEIASQQYIIKYKINDRLSFPVEGRENNTSGQAIWLSSTSFTLDPYYYQCGNIQVGDEVEFTEGAAAGYTAHIATITPGSPYTFTIDESMPDVAASDTSECSFDNFTKYKTISTAAEAQACAEGLKEMLIAKKSKWLQLKIELRGWVGLSNVRPRLEEVTVLSTGDQKYK